MKKYLCFFALIACAQETHDLMTFYEIADIKNIPQNIEYYTLDKSLKSGDIQEFKKQFYKPWHMDKVVLEAMLMKEFQETPEMLPYGSNFLQYKKEWYRRHLENAQMDTLNTVKRYGVLVESTDLHLLPTHEPLFKNYKIAGEGYPFDDNQWSYLHIGSPVFISHLSKDKAWAFVGTSEHSYGWVSIKDVAFIDEKDVALYEARPLGAITKDQTIIRINKQFITYGKIGMILPMSGENILIPRKNINNMVVWTQGHSSDIKKMPLSFEEAKNIGASFVGAPYGWGGHIGYRDCSAMTRDFFKPFAIYLPRNSRAQAHNPGIDLSSKTKEEKKAIIMKEGIPFRTLIYAKGHIGIYVGVHKNEPILWHNKWGVKTKCNGEEGRNIIGSTIFSTLELGKELRYYDEPWIDQIEKMIVL